MGRRVGYPGKRALRKARAARMRGRGASNRGGDVTIDFGDARVPRKGLAIALATMFVCAAGGIAWYVLAPGVASYEVGYTLALPGLITAMVWTGRRLPRWLDWAIAVFLAAGGMGAYVLTESTQWWLWAQAAALPLVLLVATRTSHSTRSGDPPGVGWYGGTQDGPWGPP